MTWYREIEPIQEVFPMGLDHVGRAKAGFNFRGIKAFSETFAEEIVKLLENASVGTSTGATPNIFITDRATIPPDDGPYLSIVETGGTFPERTHNEITLPAFQQPSAQLVVRARTYEAARTMALAAYAALVGVRNAQVTP